MTLFNGADSPVTTIAWRGNIVAWGDASQVRILDLATQSAICFLNCPLGVGISSPLPCCLFWESECDLLIGWADCVRHVELSTSSGVGIDDVITARSVVDWDTDCIICGISSFDADHIVILGYAPPAEADLGLPIERSLNSSNSSNSLGTLQNVSGNTFNEETEGSGGTEVGMKTNLTTLKPSAKSSSSAENGNGNGNGNGSVIALGQPEVQIIVRATGELISSDLLALHGNNEVMTGPRSFQLLSTYSCYAHGRDAQKWKLSDFLDNTPRGGLRGLAPTLFVITPSDFIAVRVRDVNDYIKRALDEGKLREAVDLAAKDRLSLRIFKYTDLVALYIEDLLDKHRVSESNGYHKNNRKNNNASSYSNSSSSSISTRNKNTDPGPDSGPDSEITDFATLAATECRRLIGNDSILWER